MQVARNFAHAMGRMLYRGLERNGSYTGDGRSGEGDLAEDDHNEGRSVQSERVASKNKTSGPAVNDKSRTQER